MIAKTKNFRKTSNKVIQLNWKKINPHQFRYISSRKNSQYCAFVIFLAQEEILLLFLSQCGLKILCLKIELLHKDRKNRKIKWKMFFETSKISAALFQRKSALFSSESTLFGYFQVMNSTESELKHFWNKSDQHWMSLRRQPGIPVKCTCKNDIMIHFIKFFSNVSA